MTQERAIWTTYLPEEERDAIAYALRESAEAELRSLLNALDWVDERHASDDAARIGRNLGTLGRLLLDLKWCDDPAPERKVAELGQLYATAQAEHDDPDIGQVFVDFHYRGNPEPLFSVKMQRDDNPARIGTTHTLEAYDPDQGGAAVVVFDEAEWLEDQAERQAQDKERDR